MKRRRGNVVFSDLAVAAVWRINVCQCNRNVMVMVWLISGSVRGGGYSAKLCENGVKNAYGGGSGLRAAKRRREMANERK